MNKRKKKKMLKKCLPLFADEFKLLTMTTDEKEKAFSDAETYRLKYGYRKKYKNLEGKFINYYYPVGTQIENCFEDIFKHGRKRGTTLTITQNPSNSPNVVVINEIGKQA